MSPAQAAHFRMMQTLPVRTHHRKPPPQVSSDVIKAGKEERIRELSKLGWTGKAIERQLRVGYARVRKVLGAKNRPRKAK